MKRTILLALLIALAGVGGMSTWTVSAAEKRPHVQSPGGSPDGVVGRARVDGGSPGKSKHCPGIARMLMGVSTFSTLVSMVGCVTPEADEFLVLYRSRDLDAFRTLAKAPTAGAQLYALCGLKHLGAEEEVETLRRELLASQKMAALNSGCDGPGPMKPVGQLITPRTGRQISDFDFMCDYLVREGIQTYRSPCDTEVPRPRCQ
jgi:hypothetical protein